MCILSVYPQSFAYPGKSILRCYPNYTSPCCTFSSPIRVTAQLSSDVRIGYELTNTSIRGTQPVAQRRGALVVQRRLMKIQVAGNRASELSGTANTKKKQENLGKPGGEIPLVTQEYPRAKRKAEAEKTMQVPSCREGNPGPVTALDACRKTKCPRA